MTREETVKVLAILKAAYPNSYSRMTPAEAKGVVTVWASQFVDVPANLVMIAVNKLIAVNTFAPSIAEVKAKIGDIYAECIEIKMIRKKMSDEEHAKVEALKQSAEKFRSKNEPALSSFLFGEGAMFLEAHDS